MKEKMSKLFETIKTNKVKVITLSAVAIITLTGAVAGVCAVAKNQGGTPMAPAASEPSESEVVASTSSETSETEASKGNTESEEEKDTTSKTETATKENAASKVSSKKETSSKETVSKLVSTHKHSYTKKVVKATCEKGGYTQFTCSCGKSYKDDKTDMLGHLYTDWKVTKKATTKSTGLKECKCDKCGGATITETIPKKKKASNIDSKVEVGTAKYTTFPQYRLGKASVTDKRTWGDAPSITVINGDTMHVVYYNKKGDKVEFTVEQPVIDDNINGFTILADGSYVGKYFGSYS